MNIFDVIFILITALYGFAKACTDIYRDHKLNNKIYLYGKNRCESTWFYKWYMGGNKNYNPSLIGDFWHFFDSKVKPFCYLFSCYLMYYIEVQVCVLILTGFGTMMITFILFYHYLFPIKPDGDYIHFMKRTFLFWINYHKA